MDKTEDNNKTRNLLENKTKNLPEKENLVADAQNLNLNHVLVRAHQIFLAPALTDVPKDANRHLIGCLEYKNLIMKYDI